MVAKSLLSTMSRDVGHQPKRLCERADRVDRQRPRLVGLAELEIALLRVVSDIAQACERECRCSAAARRDGFADLPGNRFDEREGSCIQVARGAVGSIGLVMWFSPSSAPFLVQNVVQPVDGRVPFVVAELEDLLQRQPDVGQIFLDVASRFRIPRAGEASWCR